ncbi:hypothetical protein HBB16_01310 [Pseudonocardia sp. MCCB 268]|nr:hypothetical protein [Pseudonocardia cytotoxica]
MDADRSSSEHADPWATGQRRGPDRAASPDDDTDPGSTGAGSRPRSIRSAKRVGLAGAAVLFPFLDDDPTAGGSRPGWVSGRSSCSRCCGSTGC